MCAFMWIIIVASVLSCTQLRTDLVQCTYTDVSLSGLRSTPNKGATTLHRTPAEWAKVIPSKVMEGSEAQRVNVLAMAIDDIAELGRTLECIMEAAEFNDIDACHEAARLALTRSDPSQLIRGQR